MPVKIASGESEMSCLFEAWLNEPLGLDEMVTRLRGAVRPEGHEACPAWDLEQGRTFIAVVMHGPRPGAELRRLLEKAGLYGYFEPFQGPFRLHRSASATPPGVSQRLD
jgi:hypothetical protein